MNNSQNSTAHLSSIPAKSSLRTGVSAACGFEPCGSGLCAGPFLLKGDLHAERIGPIKLNGRWDGERLRGEAWWAKQPMAVFQPLLSPDLNITLRDGDFYAQAAFSAARAQGFEAGGHMVVKNAGMWLKDGEMSGLDFVMAYRLKTKSGS